MSEVSQLHDRAQSIASLAHNLAPTAHARWTILKGELTWKIGEDRPMYNVKEGDIIFVPKGMRHHISTVGDETSLRLAVTTPEALHIYTDDDDAAPPPKE